MLASDFIDTPTDDLIYQTDVISPVQIERSKTKEQLEEEKRISLSYRVKPLHIEGLAIPKLQSKARELWDCIVKLETEKYDLEERQRRQEYDVRILYLITNEEKKYLPYLTNFVVNFS